MSTDDKTLPMLMSKGNWLKSITFVMAVGLIVSACAPDTEQIELGYVEWESEIASTHVVSAIIQDELGHEVNMTSVDAGPMWTGIARGDFDAIVAAWLPGTHEAYWDEYGDQVIDLGPNLENARIGWVVPEYTPIESIEEVNDFYDELDGQIVGIDPGAGLMAASEDALEVYGIELQLVEGSDAAMTAALESAYSDEEHIVVTGWTPHWKFASYDLKYLEDPENVFGDAEGIHTIVTPELEEKAPDVYEFLDNFYWTNDDIGEVMVMIEEGMSPMEAARAWISENEDMVQQWLGEEPVAQY